MLGLSYAAAPTLSCQRHHFFSKFQEQSEDWLLLLLIASTHYNGKYCAKVLQLFAVCIEPGIGTTFRLRMARLATMVPVEIESLVEYLSSSRARRRGIWKMRKTLWIIPLLFAAISAPNVHADDDTDYTINFTLSPPGTLPTAGSFVYDNTTNTFVSFTVDWDGLVFDLTSSANSPLIISDGPPCISGATGPQATLALMTTCNSATPAAYWDAVNPTPEQSGSNADFTFIAFGPGVTTEEIAISPPGGITGTETGDSGLGSFEAIATPEPGTSGLMLIGIIALVLVMRKRIAQRFEQIT